MASDQIQGWIDTSVHRSKPGEPARVVLSMDYATAQPVTDDTATKYVRMDWSVTLDCATRRVHDDGIVLRDAASRAVKEYPGDTGWASIDTHVTGTTTVEACRKLQELAR
jgi:hypothetical protein